MSDPTPDKPNPGLPPGIPAPPPPRPDIKDPRVAGPTYGSDAKDNKKKKKADRSHPTDTYPPLKKRRGCGGCCGCLGGFVAIALLLLAAGAVAVGWYGPGRYVSQGYTVVNLESQEATVETAPTEPTFYIAPGTLHYSAPITNVPVAFLGRELTIEGDFLDAASITGVKVTVTENSRFAKGLEVIAGEFTDLGMTLKGEMSGRVIKNLP
jgi:hypothetical protein